MIDSDHDKSDVTPRTITKSQLEDPLAFDMSKVLVFKMPKVTSIEMHDNIDDDNPSVPFKESNYYREKHHLKGLMTKKSLKQLNHQIRDMGEHRREVYDLSPDPEMRKEQVL